MEAKVQHESWRDARVADAQPRGSQTETGAVAVASIVPSLMIFLVIQGLHLQPKSCVMRDESYQLAAATNVALSCLASAMLRTSLATMLAIQLVNRVVLLHSIAWYSAV